MLLVTDVKQWVKKLIDTSFLSTTFPVSMTTDSRMVKHCYVDRYNYVICHLLNQQVILTWGTDNVGKCIKCHLEWDPIKFMYIYCTVDRITQSHYSLDVKWDSDTQTLPSQYLDHPSYIKEIKYKLAKAKFG